MPIASYLLLRGRCRYCRAAISLRYPLLEIVTGLLFAVLLATRTNTEPILTFSTVVFGYLLILIAFYDALSQRIPNILLNLLFLTAIAYQCLAIALEDSDSLQNAYAGGGFLLAFFGVQWLLSRGRALGSGDVLLGTSIGFFVGFGNAVIVLFFAYIIGAVFVLSLLLTRRTHLGSHIAFGPFLCLAAIITLVAGENLAAMLGIL